MKYAITGHTNGIGKRLYEKLSPNAVGFSLSSGYDIRIPSHRDRIIKEASDCDVFINNAHAGFCQCYLLVEMIQNWSHLPKKIINIGSRIAELDLSVDRLNLLNYQSEKLALRALCEKLKGKFTCTIEYKSFGYVGTERILKKYPTLERKDYILVDEAANIVLE